MAISLHKRSGAGSLRFSGCSSAWCSSPLSRPRWLPFSPPRASARVQRSTGLNDLRKIHVGTFADSSTRPISGNKSHRLPDALTHRTFRSARKGKIQAIIYDEPFLRYVIRTQYPGQFTVIPLKRGPTTLCFCFARRNPSPRIDQPGALAQDPRTGLARSALPLYGEQPRPIKRLGRDEEEEI